MEKTIQIKTGNSASHSQITLNGPNIGIKLVCNQSRVSTKKNLIFRSQINFVKTKLSKPC